MRIERVGEWCVWMIGLVVTAVVITTADYFLTLSVCRRPGAMYVHIVIVLRYVHIFWCSIYKYVN